ncbi:MAG: tRNA epoxyqueuosine(34) reductase QueG [Chloroflexi bacterium]|nr:tRNA epoxyqueuosine(34) reductase QueG [Chloroflexota bacterium]
MSRAPSDRSLARELAERVKTEALRVGFHAVGILDAMPFERERRVSLERHSAQYFTGMSWLTADRLRFSSDVSNLVPGARSVVSVALAYGSPREWEGGARGRIARYAWSTDYHAEIKTRLVGVRDLLLATSTDAAAAVSVDTGRVMDRAAAVRAGYGWYGKNAMVLTAGAGSWVLLGEIITNVRLEPDEPLLTWCGSCTRCMDMCPTGAIVAPGTIDARRCISYLTIENRDWIPRALRRGLGAWIFGCDVCQEVCPVNSHAALASGSRAVDPEPRLAEILMLSEPEYRRRFRHTAVMRAGFKGLKRNACVAAGNVGGAEELPALRTLLTDADPCLRGHAAWAMGEIGGTDAIADLNRCGAHEPDERVRDEIACALVVARSRAGRGEIKRGHP